MDLQTIPRILELPDEILLSIAARVVNNKDLCTLARVNRKFAHVAQEALVKEVTIPPSRIPRFLDMCLSRPDLVLKIKCVYLDTEGDDTGPSPVRDLPGLWHKFRPLIDSIHGRGQCDSISQSTQDDLEVIWNDSYRVYLRLLVAISPNLKELVVRLPEVTQPQASRHFLVMLGASPSPQPVSPFPESAQQLLKSRLRVLVLSQTTTWKNHEVHTLTLHSLTQLDRLCLPMDALIKPNGEPTAPGEVLPPRLKWLQIQPCNKNIVSWFHKFHLCHMDAALPDVRRIDLYFDSCLRSSLLLIGQGRNILGPFHEVVRSLAAVDISICGYRGTSGGSRNLVEELNAWSHLSDLEAWQVAAKGEQFSSAVARAEDGSPRDRTKEEMRVFLRGNQTRNPLRKIQRFAPRLSLHSAPTTTISFGKDQSSSADSGNHKLQTESWKQLCSSWKMGYTTAAMLPLSPLGWASTPEQQPFGSTSDFAKFDLSIFLPAALTTIPKFDANEWLAVEFFSKVKTTCQARKLGRVKMLGSNKKRRSTTSQPRTRKQKLC